MEYKILHLGSDSIYDGEFMLSAHFLFEKAFPNQNTFYLLNTYPEKFKFEFCFYQYLECNNKTFYEILSDMDNYDIIFLHNLDFFKARLVLNCKNPTKLIWFPWGKEYYQNPFLFKKKFVGSKSKFILHLSVWDRILRYIINFRDQNFNRKNNRNYIIMEAISRIKNLGILYEEEFKLIKEKKVISNDCKYLKFTYFPIEFIFKGNFQTLTNGSDILLGNSASITNNHIEAIDILNTIELKGIKIVSPLSYGDSNYAKKIIDYGTKVLGHNFTPLINFYTVREYYKIIQSCGIVIMNHYRQQAVGNILSLLWMGSKVYLDERNSVYQYLRRIGCHVYSMAEITAINQESFLTLLSPTQIENNRKLLWEELNTNRLINELKSFVNHLGK